MEYNTDLPNHTWQGSWDEEKCGGFVCGRLVEKKISMVPAYDLCRQTIVRGNSCWERLNRDSSLTSTLWSWFSYTWVLAMLCESRAVRTDLIMCSQDYMKANILVEFVSRWSLLGFDSNSTRESVFIPVIFYWLIIIW